MQSFAYGLYGRQDQKGPNKRLRCAPDCEHISQGESMKFGVVLPGGTAKWTTPRPDSAGDGSR